MDMFNFSYTKFLLKIHTQSKMFHNHISHNPSICTIMNMSWFYHNFTYHTDIKENKQQTMKCLK